MTKEKLDEVEVVLEVVGEYLKQEKDMPFAVLKELSEKLNAVKKDYDRTIKDLLVSDSLVVKLEKIIEVIGTISTISIEGETKFDNTISKIQECVDSIKN